MGDWINNFKFPDYGLCPSALPIYVNYYLCFMASQENQMLDCHHLHCSIFSEFLYNRYVIYHF